MKKFYYLSTVFLTLLLYGVSINTVAQTTATLIQPTSTGIVWQIGTSYTITWSTTPANEPVDVYWVIYNNAGTPASWGLIADDVTNSTSWNTAGRDASTKYKIQINASSGSPVLGSSINYFELTSTLPHGDGTIHVNQPNVSGIQWEPGTTHGIYWEDDLTEPVKLELWYNSGAGYVQYTGTTDLPTSVEGSGYLWNIPAGIDQKSTYRIYVKSTTTDVVDWSDNDFTITDAFYGGTYAHVIQPGDVPNLQWVKGTTHLISWIDDYIEPVRIKLYTSAGAEISATMSGIPDVDRTGTTWNWPIPTFAQTGLLDGDYVIKIFSSETNDLLATSDNTFHLSTTASGGTYAHVIQPGDVPNLQWISGSTHLISWMDDYLEPVRIKLYNTSTGLVEYPTSGIEYIDRTGSTWNWVIPPITTLPAGTYQIKLFSSVTGNEIAVSTNTFEIAAVPSGGTYVDVIQPDINGIVWQNGTTQLISWMDDLIEGVTIKLVDGTTGSDIGGATGIPTTTFTGTTWAWPIPATLTGNFKIKITSSVSGITNSSENAFDVINYTPYGEMLVIQPNGGEQWVKGNSYLISWTDNVSENVTIEVTDDNWVTSYLLTAPTGVSGSTWTWNTSTNWPVGLTATGTGIYKIRVSSVNPTTVTDDSDAAFSFVQTTGGNVVLYQPNGGEIINDNAPYLISWVDELPENVYVKLLKGGNLVPWILTGLPANAYSGPGISGSTLVWDIPETGGTCYDFDALTVGGNVANQLGGNWDTWNGAPGTGEDATVSNTHSLSGSNSFVVDRVGGTTDLLLKFGGTNLTSGVYSFSNDIYIPAGKSGYWNLSNDIAALSDPSWSEDYLGFQIRYKSTGNFDLGANGVNSIDYGTYSFDTWYHNEIVFDLDNDWCYFYIDGVLIIDYQWSKGVTGSGVNKLAFADFYADAVTDEAYFDNVCFSGDGGLYAGTNYRIRVESIYDGNYGTTSATDFTIQDYPQGGTYVTVIQPNGGEIWSQGNSYYISWIDDVIENVDIDLVDANDVFIAEIANDVPGTTHVWYIDPLLYGVGTYKVHIYSKYNSSLDDYSDNVFTISPSKSHGSIVGIGEISTSDVVIYPNPTSSQFTVAAPVSNYRIEIRNMLGQLMLSNTVESAQNTLDVSNYEAGIYIISIVTSEGLVTKKLFVQ